VIRYSEEERELVARKRGRGEREGDVPQVGLEM